MTFGTVEAKTLKGLATDGPIQLKNWHSSILDPTSAVITDNRLGPIGHYQRFFIAVHFQLIFPFKTFNKTLYFLFCSTCRLIEGDD